MISGGQGSDLCLIMPFARLRRSIYRRNYSVFISTRTNHLANVVAGGLGLNETVFVIPADKLFGRERCAFRTVKPTLGPHTSNATPRDQERLCGDHFQTSNARYWPTAAIQCFAVEQFSRQAVHDPHRPACRTEGALE
jgi:hypothetical protein